MTTVLRQLVIEWLTAAATDPTVKPLSSYARSSYSAK